MTIYSNTNVLIHDEGSDSISDWALFYVIFADFRYFLKLVFFYLLLISKFTTFRKFFDFIAYAFPLVYSGEKVFFGKFKNKRYL